MKRSRIGVFSKCQRGRAVGIAAHDMMERDTEREHQLAWMQREVDRGWEDAKAGKLTEGAAVKAEMAEMKKEWKAVG